MITSSIGPSFKRGKSRRKIDHIKHSCMIPVVWWTSDWCWCIILSFTIHHIIRSLTNFQIVFILKAARVVVVIVIVVALLYLFLVQNAVKYHHIPSQISQSNITFPVKHPSQISHSQSNLPVKHPSQISQSSIPVKHPPAKSWFWSWTRARRLPPIDPPLTTALSPLEQGVWTVVVDDVW